MSAYHQSQLENCSGIRADHLNTTSTYIEVKTLFRDPVRNRLEGVTILKEITNRRRLAIIIPRLWL